LKIAFTGIGDILRLLEIYHFYITRRQVMSMNLLEVELNNIESNGLHKPAEVSETKRDRNHRKLAARRAVEEHLERQRLKDYMAMDLLD